MRALLPLLLFMFGCADDPFAVDGLFVVAEATLIETRPDGTTRNVSIDHATTLAIEDVRSRRPPVGVTINAVDGDRLRLVVALRAIADGGTFEGRLDAHLDRDPAWASFQPTSGATLTITGDTPIEEGPRVLDLAADFAAENDLPAIHYDLHATLERTGVEIPMAPPPSGRSSSSDSERLGWLAFLGSLGD